MNTKNLFYTFSVLFAVCFISSTSVSAQDLLAGWHTFNGDTGTEMNSDQHAGITATITGGADEAANRNINNNTYGDSAFTFTSESNSTGVLANTYSNNNKRIDITITNGTTDVITIDQIVFDNQLAFGADSGSVRISHLSGSSDLSDAFGGRLLGTISFTGGVFSTVYQSTITTSAMTDVELAVGEKAAFRFEFQTTGAALGVKLDNIGVLGTVPEPHAYGLIVGAIVLVAVMVQRRRIS
tara:strand:+ start:71 stop:790 length:720 start_codon:yes stop_codon:yes gene_type:complete